MKRVNLYIDGYNFYYSIMDAADRNLKFGEDVMHVGHAWCNFKKLGEQLLNDGEELRKVVYCTAEVEKFGTYTYEEQNQQLWLDYLQEYIPNIEIKYGHHQGTSLETKEKRQKRAREALEKLRDCISSDTFHTISRGINLETRKGMVDARKVLGERKNELKNKVDNSLFNDISRVISPKRKEKMTDVNVAVEMVADSFRDKNMDIAILISKDSDFLPVVEKLYEKNIDVRMYIPPKKKKNPWVQLKKKYGLAYPTTNKLTVDQLAKSVLPYSKKDNKGSFEKEKKLPESIRKEIYNELLDRYWTYEAIIANKKNRYGFPKNDMVCNIAIKELKKTDSPDWKKTPVYDYQKGEWIIYEEIEK